MGYFPWQRFMTQVKGHLAERESMRWIRLTFSCLRLGQGREWDRNVSMKQGWPDGPKHRCMVLWLSRFPQLECSKPSHNISCRFVHAKECHWKKDCLFTRKQRHSEGLNFTLQVMFLTPCGLHKVKGLKIICSLEERWMGYAASLVQARTPSDHAEANDAYGAWNPSTGAPAKRKTMERMGQIKGLEDEVPVVSRIPVVSGFQMSNFSGVQQWSQTMDPSEGDHTSRAPTGGFHAVFFSQKTRNENNEWEVEKCSKKNLSFHLVLVD